MNSEQRRALDELFVHVPAAVEHSAGRFQPARRPGFLETWFNLTPEQVEHHLVQMWRHKQWSEEQFLDWAEGNPLDAAFLFLGAAAAAFYGAEKGINPRINTMVDAFYAIATCASVGQADIFAMTQTGRSIAALVMVLGPSLADRALNRPAGPRRSR
jgi:hypothetical protein